MQHLCTWTCGHFVILQAAACLPTSVLQHDATEGFWFLSDTAEEELANTATERHVAFTEPCDNCAATQERASVQRWRAQEDIRSLESLYISCKLSYLTSAGRYQLLDFSQKARHANDAACKSAHKQFWISSTSRGEDGFFTPWDMLAELAIEAQDLLDSGADLAEVFASINEARAALGKVIKVVNELADAVDLMAQAPDRGTHSSKDASGLRTREHMANNLSSEAFWMRMEDWLKDAGTAMLAAMEYGRERK